MRTRTVRTIAAGLLALLPALGSAFEWAGSVGLLYSRSDAWPEGADRVSAPHLDLDLRLDVRGVIGGPGIFSYSGGVGYRRIADSLDGTQTSLSSALSYRFAGNLFQNRTSPLRLNLFANRTDGTVENQGSVGTVSGDTTVARYGAHAQIRISDVPTLQTGYEFVEVDERFPALAIQRSRDSHIARFGFGHTAGGASINMRFDGDWTRGTWDADNYDQYVVTADGRSLITGRGEIYFADQYTHRDPTVASASVWGYDFNAFSLGYREGATPGDTMLASYRTVHSLIDAGGATTETVSHSARYEQDFRLGKSAYFLRPMADVTFREQRLTTGPLTSSGETLRLLLWWRKKAGPSLLEWNAGPAIGLIQESGEDARVGYGASATVRYSGPWLAQRASLTYQADWRSDLFGQPGWSIRQQGSAGLHGGGLGGRYTVQATASAYRGWTPSQGDQAQRTVQLTGSFSRFKYAGDASIGFASGTAPTVAGADFVGDGIFLPVGFDTHMLSIHAGATAELLSSLRVRAYVRASSNQAPGTPDFAYLETGGSLTYRYGAFDFSLDDRYQRSLADPPTPPVNLLMLRVARTIGTRY